MASLVLVAGLGAGCGDGGSGGGGGPAATHYDVPTGVLVDDVEVEANVPSTFTFVVDVPPFVGPLTELTVDMEATLASVGFTLDPVLRAGMYSGIGGAAGVAGVTMRRTPAARTTEVTST